MKKESPHRVERRWGDSAGGRSATYPRGIRPRGVAPDRATRALRSLVRARTNPGAEPRISDTRVRNVLAVTRRGSALSVAHDMAERPVQDRPIREVDWVRRDCVVIACETMSLRV